MGGCDGYMNHGLEREGRERKMDRKTGWEHIRGLVARIVATSAFDHYDRYWGDTRQPSQHYRENLAIVVSGLDGRTPGVLESCVVRVGGGPKRSANRGACGAKFLVGRLNQMVSIHPDMANAPTHHNPGTHDFLTLKQRHAPQNPRRRRKRDPNRGGLDQSRY